MNWLVIIVLFIIIIAMIRGFHRGFLRVLYSLVAIILLIALIGYATPHVNHFLKENTQVHSMIAERWTDRVEDSANAAVESAAEGQKETMDAAGIQLPEILESYVFGDGVQSAQEILDGTGVYQQAGEQMADVIVGILAFLIALLLAVIIVWIIGKATDIVNKIPVIKGINRFLGIFAGALQGFIVVWLLFMLVALISGTSIGKILISCINDSRFLYVLYENNVILEIITSFFGL